jgi:molybdopterin biosynthesis enzyme
VRVRVADGVATPVLGQASHQLTATASADGFVAIPDGDGAAAGDVVPFTGW